MLLSYNLAKKVGSHLDFMRWLKKRMFVICKDYKLPYQQQKLHSDEAEAGKQGTEV